MAALIKDTARPGSVWMRRGHWPHPVPPPPPTAELDWAASGWAGVVAGLSLLALETFGWPLLHGVGFGAGVERIAAIALGRDALTTTSFTGFVVFAGLMVHLPLSLVYARLLGVMIRRRPLAQAVAVGILFGAALYAVNFHLLTGLGLFPWFKPLRGPDTLVFHMLYGVIVAWVYERRAAIDRERETLSEGAFPPGP